MLRRKGPVEFKLKGAEALARVCVCVRASTTLSVDFQTSLFANQAGLNFCHIYRMLKVIAFGCCLRSSIVQKLQKSDRFCGRTFAKAHFT